LGTRRGISWSTGWSYFGVFTFNEITFPDTIFWIIFGAILWASLGTLMGVFLGGYCWLVYTITKKSKIFRNISSWGELLFFLSGGAFGNKLFRVIFGK
jgi:hypothetical protein